MKIKTRTLSLLIVLFLVSTLNITTSNAQDSPHYMYWTDPGAGKIQRANLDGTNVQNLVTGLVRPVGIELDLAAGKMYWTDRDSHDFKNPNARTKILRANLDGSNIETLVTGEALILLREEIALDLTAGKMYWTDTDSGAANRIQRANLDGSNIETLVTEVHRLRGIALDLTNGKMYWTDPGGDPGAGKIQRANLDGSNIETLVTGLSSPHHMALDLSGEQIYWTDYIDGKIQRANFNGLNLEDLVTGLNRPIGIALDSLNGKVYWADPHADKIQRANLDGSNIEDLVTTGLVDPVGITLDTSQPNTARPPDVPDESEPSVHYIYWAAWGLGKIQRINLDGSNLQDLVTGLRWPRDVALDIAGNKMYWVDAGANKVQRANLDGTNVEDLVNAQGRPFGVALDTTSGKMYWSIWNPGKIRRANLDGTNVEDFVTGLRDPEDIDLDIAGGKIYWTDTVTNKIQRANLDGSNIEDLVTVGLSHPLGLTLDVAGGKIYWTNTSFWPWGGPELDEIHRANFDGTNVERLVTTGLASAHGIALDVSAGKMYWADQGRIQRANLDGSNVEDIITGIGATGIAIGIPQPNTARPPDVPDESEPSVETPSFEPGKLYWTTNDKIRRADLDGSNIQEIVTDKKNLRGLAVDSADEKIYWTVAWTLNTDVVPKIQTADLDGSDIQDLVERVGNAQGIAVDSDGNKMYWTRGEKIQTASLDGMNTQSLITSGLHTPQSIALDITNNKVYWTASRLNKIQRADLDGSNIQDVVEDVETPYGIALDVAANKMYWTARGTSVIQCANLDGSNIQDVVTDVNKPGSIAVDVEGRKIYWTEYEFVGILDRGVGKIRRADLNGSNVKDVVTGLGTIYSIALGIPQATAPTTTDEPDDVYSTSDVNKDGQTDALDVCLVAAALWQTSPNNPRTDVNGDGIVDAKDVILVAENLDAPQVPAAPLSVRSSRGVTPETIQRILNLLRAANNGSLVFQEGIANLERLLASIIPRETGLLANYPNPFNPETWIPYQLAKPADVTVSIYSVDGSLIQTLLLGYQAAGIYQSRSRAAYWDGKNQLGESVASGVYFYTLTAGDFTATRKMLIRK